MWFILLGAFHGIAYCIEYFMKKKYTDSNCVPKFTRWLLTFGFLNLIWIIVVLDIDWQFLSPEGEKERRLKLYSLKKEYKKVAES